jgi:hypothetical protein
VAGGATAGESLNFRLDPDTLPARSVPASQGGAEAAFIIDRDKVVVRKSLGTGALVPTAVALNDYQGVAARIEPVGDQGDVRAYVELWHDDPMLIVTLASSDEPEDIAADWQAWGRALNLPLLIVGQDGSVSDPLAGAGVRFAQAKPRRKHAYFAGRRPRFLTRRKTGSAVRLERIGGREIIARD